MSLAASFKIWIMKPPFRAQLSRSAFVWNWVDLPLFVWFVLLLLSKNLTQWNTSTQRYTHLVISLQNRLHRGLCVIFSFPCLLRFFFLLLYICFSMQNCRIFCQFVVSLPIRLFLCNERIRATDSLRYIIIICLFFIAHYQWNETSWVTSILPKVVLLLYFFFLSILSTRYVYRTQNKEKHTFFFCCWYICVWKKMYMKE